MSQPHFTWREWIFACIVVILLILMVLWGCKGPVARLLPSIPPAPIEKPVTSTTPAPKTADEWRAQKQTLLDCIDANDRANADLRQQIGASDRRTALAEQDAQRATARTQAAWGRRIAFAIFALSTLCTILSFTPWGAILPKWVGPAGCAAATSILVAAQSWVWVADHLMLMSTIAIALGAVVAGLVLLKSSILLRIRQTYCHAMETANGEADELNAKAASLTAELDAGVHALGQRLRGKPRKTYADVIALQDAAAGKARTVPIVAPELVQ